MLQRCAVCQQVCAVTADRLANVQGFTVPLCRQRQQSEGCQLADLWRQPARQQVLLRLAVMEAQRQPAQLRPYTCGIRSHVEEGAILTHWALERLQR
jgi:hypothetical protein